MLIFNTEVTASRDDGYADFFFFLTLVNPLKNSFMVGNAPKNTVLHCNAYIRQLLRQKQIIFYKYCMVICGVVNLLQDIFLSLNHVSSLCDCNSQNEKKPFSLPKMLILLYFIISKCKPKWPNLTDNYLTSLFLHSIFLNTQEITF